MRDKYDVHLLASSKKFSANIEIWTSFACCVEKICSDMQRRRMTIIDTESMKVSCHQSRILCHMIPQPWIIFLNCERMRGMYRTRAVTQLDTVTPDDNLAAEIRRALWSSEIFK